MLLITSRARSWITSTELLIKGNGEANHLSTRDKIMKVNKDTLSKLRTLYFNLTGNSAVLDDYSFFKYLCNNGSWIQCFWLCKKAIDKMFQEGKKPTYKLYNAKSGQVLPFETVNNYYHF